MREKGLSDRNVHGNLRKSPGGTSVAVGISRHHYIITNLHVICATLVTCRDRHSF